MGFEDDFKGKILPDPPRVPEAAELIPLQVTVEKRGAKQTVSYTVAAGDVTIWFLARSMFRLSITIGGIRLRMWWDLDTRVSRYREDKQHEMKKPAQYAEDLKPFAVALATAGSPDRAKALANEENAWTNEAKEFRKKAAACYAELRKLKVVPR